MRHLHGWTWPSSYDAYAARALDWSFGRASLPHGLDLDFGRPGDGNHRGVCSGSPDHSAETTG